MYASPDPRQSIDLSKTFERLRTELGISRGQLPAWNSLVAQLMLSSELLDITSRPSTPLEGPSLRAALQDEFERLHARLEIIAALQPALQLLYVVLSPRQRIHADRLLRALCGVFAADRRSAWDASGERCMSSKPGASQVVATPWAA
jgi:hypothetical protein